MRFSKVVVDIALVRGNRNQHYRSVPVNVVRVRSAFRSNFHPADSNFRHNSRAVTTASSYL